MATDYRQFAVIHASTNGNNTIVAASTGRKIRVLSLFLVAAGTVTVTFQTGAGGTALTGVMPLVVNNSLVLPYNKEGWFETAVSALLNAALSAGVAIEGGLTYMEV